MEAEIPILTSQNLLWALVKKADSWAWSKAWEFTENLKEFKWLLRAHFEKLILIQGSGDSGISLL